jgi:hypothetical protein
MTAAVFAIPKSVLASSTYLRARDTHCKRICVYLSARLELWCVLVPYTHITLSRFSRSVCARMHISRFWEVSLWIPVSNGLTDDYERLVGAAVGQKGAQNYTPLHALNVCKVAQAPQQMLQINGSCKSQAYLTDYQRGEE